MVYADEGDDEEEEEDDDLYGVWPENREIVAVFQAMGTQWDRDVGMGGVIWWGLKYEALNEVYRSLDVKRQPGHLSELQAMEFTALSVLNKKD
ncbi:MAG TPA: DUF1799 domain-containing protein [Usitatibacteraceae bacterium]